jgi:hypothetical protein
MRSIVEAASTRRDRLLALVPGRRQGVLREPGGAHPAREAVDEVGRAVERDLAAGDRTRERTLSGVFGWLMIVFGGLVGRGVALSRAVAPATASEAGADRSTLSAASQPA